MWLATVWVTVAGTVALAVRPGRYPCADAADRRRVGRGHPFVHGERGLCEADELAGQTLRDARRGHARLGAREAQDAADPRGAAVPRRMMEPVGAVPGCQPHRRGTMGSSGTSSHDESGDPREEAAPFPPAPPVSPPRLHCFHPELASLHCIGEWPRRHAGNIPHGTRIMCGQTLTSRRPRSRNKRGSCLPPLEPCAGRWSRERAAGTVGLLALLSAFFSAQASRSRSLRTGVEPAANQRSCRAVPSHARRSRSRRSTARSFRT
jgi:hypothetical protein